MSFSHQETNSEKQTPNRIERRMESTYHGPYGHEPQHAYGSSHAAAQQYTGERHEERYGSRQWQSDAQAAARKAFATRNSRSYSSRVSRTRSRKRELTGKPAKPTIDTSFLRHRGARQVYPSNDENRTGGSTRRPTWFGVGRSGTRSKGLGIMKGTPQVDSQPVDYIASLQEREPGTAYSLTPGTKAWMEISPSDRPIPIGISLPSDSVSDLSPEQHRHTSESDATLVTPSIIITPAAAMKSVWSPDTPSDYTASIYSTVNPYPSDTNVPPVPALPTTIPNSRYGVPQAGSQEPRAESPSRSRNGTLDSAGTTFEDDDFDAKRKDRIMSTGTVFEEDELPLTDMRSKLSVDTSSFLPTPRRSQGWWNYITTPFEFSRQNSVWTQGGRNGEKTPDIPMLPQRFMPQPEFIPQPDSPSGRTTYLWTPSEQSPSINGEMTLPPIMLSNDVNAARQIETESHQSALPQNGAGILPTVNVAGHTNNNTNNITIGGFGVGTRTATIREEHSDETVQSHVREAPSSLPGKSVAPAVRTAAVMMPLEVTSHAPQFPQHSQQASQYEQQHQQQSQQPINVNIILQDRRKDLDFRATDASLPSNERSVHIASSEPRASTIANIEMPTPSTTHSGSPPVPQAASSSIQSERTRGRSPSQSPPKFAPPPTQPRKGFSLATQERAVYTVSNTATTQERQPATFDFPPPPHFAQSNTDTPHNGHSRSSSPSLLEKGTRKQHRKVFNFADWLRFGKAKRNDNQETPKKETSRRKKWCWACCCCLLILVLLAILIPVVVVVTRKHNSDVAAPNPTTPSQAPLEGTESNWHTVSGFPPMPTGVATVAQPEAVEEKSGCTQPNTAWSCAVPKEEQQAIKPNKPDQPNLKFEITVDNSSGDSAKRGANPVSAGSLVRSTVLYARAAQSASPAPPAIADYKFLGRTTDNNALPYEGSASPFRISILGSNTPPSSRLAKRANITDPIPPPELERDGTAAAATLLPTVSNQPLRLFNKGTDEEHYGFFVYYNRSIFLKSIEGDFSFGGNPSDTDGGSVKDAATLRCTWAQTRFLVQIWTRSESSKPLLGSSSPANADDKAAFKRPGSFPYPVTMTVDRHGGNARDKMAFCYEMEKDGSIRAVDESKSFLFEDRAFGGNLVNPTEGVFGKDKGPVDGGTGGCKCQWQNWLAA